jgi:hypothetical protein
VTSTVPGFFDVAARLGDAATARAELDRIEAHLTAKNARLLDLYRAGDHPAAEQLHREIRGVVAGEWLPALRAWARAADRAGQLPEADRFLLHDDDDDDGEVVDGYRRVGQVWMETEARAQCCLRHADRPVAPGDRLYCRPCRAEADAKELTS